MEAPRVTEVLKYFTGYDHVPQNILKGAAERGTTVHALCAAIANGSWVPISMIDEHLQGYVKSFLLWKEAQVEEFLIVEKRYMHPEALYTGQIDFVTKCNDGMMWLVDIKTSSSHQKTYALQMGAYGRLLKLYGVEVFGAMIVYLDKNGEFPDIYVVDDLEKEFVIFKSALDCWIYLKTRNENVRKIRAKHTPENTGDNVGLALHREGKENS